MTGFMHAMSFIGSASLYVPLLLVVYWCFDPRLGARASVLLLGSGIINGLLKAVFHEPRPYWTSGVTEYESQDSFGMPSGHAQSAVVVWGFIAVWLLRWASRTGRGRVVGRYLVPAGAVVIIALIGVSRIYLHVHSPLQVVVGWAVGATLLVAFLVLEPFVTSWWRARPLWLQIALSLAIALAFLGATIAAVAELREWKVPTAWSQVAGITDDIVAHHSLREGTAGAGGLFGGLAGISWLAHRGWFEPGGAPWPRLARLPVGLAGAVVLWWAATFTGAAIPVIFVMNALLALWLTAAAPEIFVLTRLARRSPRGIPADHPAA